MKEKEEESENHKQPENNQSPQNQKWEDSKMMKNNCLHSTQILYLRELRTPPVAGGMMATVI